MIDPHGASMIEERGAPLARAKQTVILLHGRGASSNDMFGLSEYIGIPEIAYVAPTAAGGSWWPTSFLAAHAEIEPYLNSALSVVERCVACVTEEGGTAENTTVLGFSQGACLALEYAARATRSLRAGIGFSGGLIGTADKSGAPTDALYGFAPKQFDYQRRRDGMRVFIGCHERDPHIPMARIQASAEVFTKLGAEVKLQVYPGAGHGIVEEEIRYLRALLNQ